jgi:uncharacterized protein YdaT
MKYQHHEHVKAMLEEGYSESDIADITRHSREWVQNARKWKRGI